MNRKGDTGDFLSSVTVFMGVAGIMAIFTLLSMGLLGLSAIKDAINYGITSEMRVNNIGLLFEQIDIDGSKMPVLAAHWNASNAMDYEKVAQWGKFENEIKKLTPLGGCLFLYSGVDASIAEGYSLKNNAGNVETADYSIGEVISSSSLVPISFVRQDGSTVNMTYLVYRGRCP